MDKVFKDIAYSAQSGAQKLDIYLPSNVSEPYPVIVWLHPGGYTGGDKSMVEMMLDYALDRGYAVVSVNYRLADESGFPAQLMDAKAAVRWIKANAATYGLDKDSIAAWGVSAGSTFAALLGTTAHIKELEDLAMGNPGESSRVNAIVDIIGPVDFLNFGPQLIKLGFKTNDNIADPGISMLIGGPPAEFPERCRAMDPVSYLTGDCPPFYIQHGTADRVVPYLQSVNLAEALVKTIGQEKVALNLLENVDHFDGEHNAPENVKKALDFLDKYIRSTGT
jgi:acetyl esterase/lipase